MAKTYLAPPPHPTQADDYVPARADWLIDQNWSAYTKEDHHTWSILYDRMTKVLDGKCSSLFMQGLEQLQFERDQIPNFIELSNRLKKFTDFEVVAVPGLIPDDIFFEHLANRRFPSGCIIRKPNELDFQEYPDVFHDIFGHVPLLMFPEMADFMQACGKAAVAANQKGMLDFIARLYWYIVEVGLVRENGKTVCLGAAINSSEKEVAFSLYDQSPNRILFDLERVMLSDFWIYDLQNTYFVLDSILDLREIAKIDFDSLFPKLLAQEKIKLGEVKASDKVLSIGSGSYHLEYLDQEELVN